MTDSTDDIVDEMLGMAKAPSAFSKDDMVEIIMVAATEIMKLRQNMPLGTRSGGAGRELSGSRHTF